MPISPDAAKKQARARIQPTIDEAIVHIDKGLVEKGLNDSINIELKRLEPEVCTEIANLYRSAGWEVSYKNAPSGMNETSTFFTFKAQRSYSMTDR